MVNYGVSRGWFDPFINDSKDEGIKNMISYLVLCAWCTIVQLLPGILTPFHMPNKEKERKNYLYLQYYVWKLLQEPEASIYCRMLHLLVKARVEGMPWNQLYHNETCE